MARAERAKAISPGSASDAVASMLEIKYMPDYNHEDPADVEEQTAEFLKKCVELDLVPGLELYATALHISREELEAWLRAGDRRGEVVREAYQFIRSVTEQMGAKGYMSPSTMIFTQKNNYGYADESRKITEGKTALQELPSKEDILARLPAPLEEKRKRGRPRKRPEGE